MRALLLALLSLSACGPLTPLKVDAGSTSGGSAGVGGGVATGGGAAGGGVAGGGVAGGTGGGVAGGTGGGSTAGGTAGGSVAGGAAGGSGDGGLGPFSWSSMSLVPTPSSASSAAISARPGEAYATVSTKLYRSTGMAFNEVSGFPALSTVADVLVTPAGNVFVVSRTNSSWFCLASDCSLGANYTSAVSGGSSDYFDGLCNAGETVFAIGNGSNSQAILFQFNGTGWTKISNDLGFNGAKRCVAGPSGEVYVLGKTFVVRYEAGGFTQENVDLLGQSPAEWNDMAMTFGPGGLVEGMLVGGIGNGGSVTSYRYARRNVSGGGWTALPIPMVGSSLNAVVATGPSEYLAAGFSSTAAHRFMAWGGTMWGPSANQPPTALMTVSDAAANGDREVFLIGSGTGGAVLIRGRR